MKQTPTSIFIICLVRYLPLLFEEFSVLSKRLFLKRNHLLPSKDASCKWIQKKVHIIQNMPLVYNVFNDFYLNIFLLSVHLSSKLGICLSDFEIPNVISSISHLLNLRNDHTRKLLLFCLFAWFFPLIFAFFCCCCNCHCLFCFLFFIAATSIVTH